ncbi:MAG: ABC transporter permease [Akkermansiaceae bacterium]|nr:ABC transporter permease [Akkermansiaceae bacterium]
MSLSDRFSFARFWAMVVKESIQLRRDRMTFAMMLGIPILQIFLFGFVINGDPRHLPTAVLMADDGPAGRALLAGFKNSSYFDFTQLATSEEEAREWLATGKVQFVVNIPQGFTRELLKGGRPVVLIEADASDPTATQTAVAAVNGIIQTWVAEECTGPLTRLANRPPPVETRVHALYNPEAITQFNIVPGLIGVVLTISLVMIPGLAITRERERGTMENLLSMPLRPAEVLIGKITLYIIIGYVQIGIILLAARFVFGVPIHGNLVVLLVASLLFIAANLAMGITFSTVARNQLQAMQMTLFVFLPSILLSGFMFPFRGMPVWAQWIGEVLPITHFIRVARGVMLKGAGFSTLVPEILAIGAFALVMMTLGITRYRQTLD